MSTGGPRKRPGKCEHNVTAAFCRRCQDRDSKPAEPKEEPKQVQAPEEVWVLFYNDGRAARLVESPSEVFRIGMGAIGFDYVVRYVKAGGQ